MQAQKDKEAKEEQARKDAEEKLKGASDKEHLNNLQQLLRQIDPTHLIKSERGLLIQKNVFKGLTELDQYLTTAIENL